MSDAARSDDEPFNHGAARASRRRAAESEGGNRAAEPEQRDAANCSRFIAAHGNSPPPDAAFQRRAKRGRGGKIRDARLAAARAPRRAWRRWWRSARAAAAAHVHALRLARAEQAQAHALAERLDAMSTRLESLEANRSRDELASLRKVLAEIKAGAASTRDVGGAVGQLAARVDKLEKEQGARLDKLGDRIDHDAAARLADVAGEARQAEGQDAVASVAAAAPPAKPRRPRRRGCKGGAGRLHRDHGRDRKAAAAAARVLSRRDPQRLRDDRQPRPANSSSGPAISCLAADGCCGSSGTGAAGRW